MLAVVWIVVMAVSFVALWRRSYRSYELVGLSVGMWGIIFMMAALQLSLRLSLDLAQSAVGMIVLYLVATLGAWLLGRNSRRRSLTGSHEAL